jgi:hypothetical protein
MIGSVAGAIRYRDLVNNQSIDRGMLPAPSIDTNALRNLTPPYSEFSIGLEQRVPSTLAAQMSNSLSMKGIVQLDLSSLDIRVAQEDTPDTRQRLPIWDGVSCQERDGVIFVGRMINLAATDTLGAKASVH